MEENNKGITRMVTTATSSRPLSYSQPLVSNSVIYPSRHKHILDDDARNNASAARSYTYPHNLRSPHSGPATTAIVTSTNTTGSHHSPSALPEFVGRGGGVGIFKLPARAAMLPGRPPPLEIRPHPHRETQVGAFLRTIECTSSQLWAGSESGVRVWDLDDVFEEWSGEKVAPAKPKAGDEESAPFRESSRTSPTLCLAVDEANGLVWSGHKDGKIRSWRMQQKSVTQQNVPRCKVGNATSVIATTANTSTDDACFKEGLSWRAHDGPVLSLAISSYGELWSGSEGGNLMVWLWEAIEKSLSLSMKERHVAALLVERSFVDLKSMVTVGGLPPVDIKHLLPDNSRSKVWSGDFLSFAIWDSRTKELLKVFGLDGHVETQIDTLPVQDLLVEDETKMKFVSSSKKGKSQLSFFQKSRNALMGAADAVRRVAVKGAFGDDYRRAEVLTLSMDGLIWMGCTNGMLVQWDWSGNRLQEIHHLSCSVKAICAFSSRLWIGYASGTVHVMDLRGNLIGGWTAHNNPVIKMAVGGPYIFTLANHGGIRGWYLSSPGPVDNILRSELSSKELLYTKFQNLKILAGTWNVGQERASHDSLISWLGCAASEVGLVVVGLQEVEMGAGFLAMAAAKETVGREGSTNGQWWLDIIGKILDEGTSFYRVGSRQLAGLLIAVWARKYLRPQIGDVDAAAVACGLGRAIGNKGAVGLKMRVYDRIMCFVNCHFAAHLEAVNRRNSDFDHIYRTMTFSRPSNGSHATAAGTSSIISSHCGSNLMGILGDDKRPELSEADMIVFLGDLNYRLHSITYDEARDLVSQRCFDWLREKDQLRQEMKAGRVFQGMREAQIKFPPTYKFQRNHTGLSGYDSSEKKRIPAWCDRILYRDSKSILVAECSLECPIVSSVSEYDACMDVTDSDHKPVRCIFNVDIAHADELTRRQQYGAITGSHGKVKLLLEDCLAVPETIVRPNDITLHNGNLSFLKITNRCDKDKATYVITCKAQCVIIEEKLPSEVRSRCSFGFPKWLKVIPAAGVLNPGQTVEISLQHEEFNALEELTDGIPPSWWSQNTRDKEVILLVNITGSFSTESKSHEIYVRHTFSSISSKVI